MSLRQNTWKLNQWYDQDVAGNVSYSGTQDLFGWGSNTYGELGQNNTTKYSSPVQLAGSWTTALSSGGTNNTETVVFVGGGGISGSVWAWGRNSSGMLGQNQAPAQLSAVSSPVQIGSDTTWAQAFCGSGTVVGTKTDGTLWTWGYNDRGQLGQNQNSPTGSYSSPTQVGTDTTWDSGDAKIAQGTSPNTYAIKTDGTLWAWGGNSYGSLGQNNETQYSSPVQIPGTTWSTLANGGGHSIGAIKTDGTLWSWGYGAVGQMGQNNVTHYSSPVQIPGTTWATIKFTAKMSIGTKTDGTLWTWGKNDKGQLGQNQSSDNAHCSSPVQIPGTTWATDPISVSYAYPNSMGAIKTDGTLWTWGNNQYGMLGHNSETRRSSPKQVPGSWSGGVGVKYSVFGQQLL